MATGPRDPQTIAQQIIDDDTAAIEDLLNGTEIEDMEDAEEEALDYDLPLDDEPLDNIDSDIEYF